MGESLWSSKKTCNLYFAGFWFGLFKILYQTYKTLMTTINEK